MKISLRAGLLVGAGMLTAFSSAVVFAYDPIYPPVPNEGTVTTSSCKCDKIDYADYTVDGYVSKQDEMGEISVFVGEDIECLQYGLPGEFCRYMPGESPNCRCKNVSTVEFKNLTNAECAAKEDYVTITNCSIR